jgi:prepilin-type N-terminal cleavage/methylation domain-containing protein
MKTAILLKLLQSCDNTATPNFPNTRYRKSDKGFTLLELIVIVLILGILASIAAPGWLGFINRQRVRTVNDRVFQSLRLAQSEAKRTKRDVTVTFDKNVDPPKVTFSPALPTGGTEQKLDAGGEIKSGTIALTFNKPDSTDPKKSSLTFDYQGNPDKTSFIVAVSAVKGGGKQCAIVETIIGGMRTADQATDCPTLP